MPTSYQKQINTDENDKESPRDDNPCCNLAAWLPGMKGAGITDVLFGDFGFTGKLPVTWPNAVMRVLFTLYTPIYGAGV